jgi:hypothetical protein
MKNKERGPKQVLEPEVQKPKVGYKGAKEQIMFHNTLLILMCIFLLQDANCKDFQREEKLWVSIFEVRQQEYIPIFTQQMCVMLDFCYVLTIAQLWAGWRRQGHDWRLHWNEVVLATHTIIKFEVLVPSRKVRQYGSAICNHYAVLFSKEIVMLIKC